jgi:hypothetical protein
VRKQEQFAHAVALRGDDPIDTDAELILQKKAVDLFERPLSRGIRE